MKAAASHSPPSISAGVQPLMAIFLGMAEASKTRRGASAVLARFLMLLALSFAALVQPAAAQSVLRDAETETLFKDMSRPIIAAAGFGPKMWTSFSSTIGRSTPS
jgi:hypothetical protein